MTRIFLLKFLESYFRHRWLFLLPIVVTTAAGIIFLFKQEPKYISGGILYVNNQSLLNSLTAIPTNNPNWWMTPAQATSNEINNLLKTNAFVRAIIKETDIEAMMGGDQAQVQEALTGVRESLWVTPVGNNEVYLQASLDDPQLAYQIVNSMVTAYINWQINKEVLDSQVAKTFFDDLTIAYAQEIELARINLREYLEGHPVPLRLDRPIGEQLEIERLQNEVSMAAARLETTLHKSENANLVLQQVESDVRQTYLLLDAPLVPGEPEISKRKLAMQLAVFSAAGVLMSIIGITGSALLDRSVRFPIDIRQNLNLPVLAVVPDISARPGSRLLGRRKPKPVEQVGTEHAEVAPEAGRVVEGLNLNQQTADKGVDISR